MISSLNCMFNAYYNSYGETYDIILSANPNYKHDDTDKLFKRINCGNESFGLPNFSIIIDTRTNYINVTHIFNNLNEDNRKLGNALTTKFYKDAEARIFSKLNANSDSFNDRDFDDCPCYDFQNKKILTKYTIKYKKREYEGVYVHGTLAVKVIKICNFKFATKASRLLYAILTREGICDNTTLKTLTLDETKSLIQQATQGESLIPREIQEFCENKWKETMEMNEEIRKNKLDMIYSGKHDVTILLVHNQNYKVKIFLSEDYEQQLSIYSQRYNIISTIHNIRITNRDFKNIFQHSIEPSTPESEVLHIFHTLIIDNTSY